MPHFLHHSEEGGLSGHVFYCTPLAGNVRSFLMVVQSGLSVTLLVVAGLFARTVALLLDEGAGVEPTRALVVRVVLGDTPILDASERDHRLVEEMVARPHGYLGSTDCASQTDS